MVNEIKDSIDTQNNLLKSEYTGENIEIDLNKLKELEKCSRHWNFKMENIKI